MCAGGNPRVSLHQAAPHHNGRRHHSPSPPPPPQVGVSSRRGKLHFMVILAQRYRTNGRGGRLPGGSTTLDQEPPCRCRATAPGTRTPDSCSRAALRCSQPYSIVTPVQPALLYFQPSFSTSEPIPYPVAGPGARSSVLVAARLATGQSGSQAHPRDEGTSRDWDGHTQDSA